MIDMIGLVRCRVCHRVLCSRRGRPLAQIVALVRSHYRFFHGRTAW